MADQSPSPIEKADHHTTPAQTGFDNAINPEESSSYPFDQDSVEADAPPPPPDQGASLSSRPSLGPRRASSRKIDGQVWIEEHTSDGNPFQV